MTGTITRNRWSARYGRCGRIGTRWVHRVGDYGARRSSADAESSRHGPPVTHAEAWVSARNRRAAIEVGATATYTCDRQPLATAHWRSQWQLAKVPRLT